MTRPTAARRSFVVRIAVCAALLRWLPATAALRRPDPRALRQAALASLLAELQRSVADRAGADDALRYLATASGCAVEIVACSEADVLDALIGAAWESESVPTVNTLRTRIDRQIRADFAARAIVDVDGWQLARTEALLIALAARHA